MTISCQVTCDKEKTHDNIVKIVKLQGNAPKKWGGEWKKSGMAAAIPAIPPATPLLGIIIYLGNFIALLLILICGLLPLFTRFFLWRSRAAGNAAFRFLSHDFVTPIQLNYTKAVKPGIFSQY